MSDYRKMPLGPLAPNRIGKIVECPYCHERGLKVEDFKDPISGSKEKETVYIHYEHAVLNRKIENGRPVEEYEIITNACSAKIKPNLPRTPSPEETPLE
jgi:hypothetical protein